MKMTLLLPVLICAAAWAAPTETFDRAPVGDRLPSGWRPYLKPDGDGTAGVVAGGDNRFVRIAAKGTRGANAVGMSRSFGARSDQPYRISVEARNAATDRPEAKLEFNVIFLTRSGKYVNAKKFRTPTLSAEFSSFSLDAVAPPEAKEMIVELYVPWNTPATIDVDNLTIEPLTPAGQSFAVFGKRQIEARELYLDTPLVKAGKPAAILVTGGATHLEMAREINRAIREKTGVELPVVAADSPPARSRSQNRILLGNAHDNPAVADLYFRHYVILDSRYPGRGGDLVRTLHNPFADGLNVVFAGGSDADGHRRSAEKLAGIIRALPAGGDLTLPRLAEINYPKAAELKFNWGCEWESYFNYDPIGRDMAAFYMTGEHRYVDDMLKRIFPDEEMIRNNNKLDRYDDGRDPVVKPYHYWAAKMALYWDLIEEDPAFTPEIRQRITEKFYQQMQYWIESGYGGWYRIYLNPQPHTALRDRHYLMEALCVYAVCRYFDKYYPSIDSAEGLRCVRNVFAPLWNSVTPQQSWKVWSPSMLFPALQYGFWENPGEMRTNPNVRGYADYLLTISSLRPGEWLNGFPGIYGGFAMLYDDEAFSRMQKLNLADPEATKIGFAFFEPGRKFTHNTLEQTAGKVVRTHVSGEKMNYQNLPAGLAPARVDEFYAYRGRPDETGDYLLLGPKYRPEGRGAFYNFAIEMLLLGGVEVLSGPSQLYPAVNGLASDRPAWYAEVGDGGTAGESVFFSGQVSDFNDHDWSRAILLRRNRFVLIFDRLEPRRSGLSRLENLFRLAPYSEAAVDPAGNLVITAGNALPDPAATKLRRNGKDLFAARFDGEKQYFEFTGATVFRSLAPDKPVAIDFELAAPVEDELVINLLPQPSSRGKLIFTLDGRELPERPELKIGETPQFAAVSLGRHRLAAGRHLLTLRPDAETGDWALGGLALGRRENRFSIGSGLDADAELRRVLLTGPDGGAAVPGYTGSFVTMKTLAKGTATEFFTLLRPGVETGRLAAAGPDGRTALKLPEKALAIPSGAGFLLVESDHLSGWHVAEVAGLFKRPAPVAFDYDAVTGELAVLEADSRVTQTEVKNFRIPGSSTLNSEVDAIFAAAAKFTAPKDALPPLRVVREYAFDAPVNRLVSFRDKGNARTAIAAGKTLAVLDGNGEERWRKTLDGEIGALCYWEKADLVVTGDRGEMIRAFTPDGVERWSVRSESAPEFIATNKTFWFKKVYSGIYALAAAELIPGQSRLFAGSTGTVEVIAPDGKVEQRFWQDYGPVTDFAFFEAEKGRPARIFASRAFGAWPTTWSILAEEGKIVSNNSWMLENHSGAEMNKYGFSGVGKHSLQSVRLEPGGEQLLLGVFDGAQNGAMLWEYNGRVRAGVNLDSGEVANAVDYARRALSPRNVRGLAAADLDGDGRREIVIATSRKLLYLFDDRFRLRQCIELGQEPTALAVAPGRIAVGGAGGEVRLFDPNGKALASCPVAGPVTALEFTAPGLLIGAGGKLIEVAL